MLLIFHAIMVALILVLIIWLDVEREYYKASFKIAEDGFNRAIELNRKILDSVQPLKGEK